MNRNTSGSFTLTKASTGFINYKTAEGLAQLTLYSYERTLVKWIENMGDCPVTSIASQDLSGHLTWLRTEYTPERLSGKIHLQRLDHPVLFLQLGKPGVQNG